MAWIIFVLPGHGTKHVLLALTQIPYNKILALNDYLTLKA